MNQSAKEVPTQPTARLPKDGLYRILSLDGGGAKGFYTLGVLREVEGLVGARLHEKFDLIFGTSTGAIIAAMLALGHSIEPVPTARMFSKMWWADFLQSVTLLQKTWEINTQSMDQLRSILFKDVQTIRISEAYTQPEMATDLFEHDMAKLNVLWQRGRESFASRELQLKQFLV
jgi:predicted acylesterase/phospholipase RssA